MCILFFFWRDIIKIRSNTAAQIRRLRLIFRRIYLLKEDISQVYASSILTSIMTIFVEVVFFIFLCIIIFQKGSNGVHSEGLFIIIISAPIMFTRLSSIILGCEVMFRRNKKLKFVVSRMCSDAESEDVKAEVGSTFFSVI